MSHMSQVKSSLVDLKPTWGLDTIFAIVLIVCATTSAHCASDHINVAEASAGLAFSESEVGDRSVDLRKRFLATIELKQEEGCLAQCRKIARVWERLLPVIQAQQPKALARPSLEIVNSKDVDALSFAEGTIIISEEYVSRLELDNEQIAFVLAHEVSHILLQHERQTLTSAMALMPSRIARSASDVHTEMEERYFSMDTYFSLIAHQTEFEADEVGLEIAALAGFDPRKQLEFMQKLARNSVAQSMMSTHPEASQRLDRLRDLLPLAYRLYEGGGP